MAAQIKINHQRFLDDLQQLRQFGKNGNGVVRQSFSEIDIESRHWLVEKMQQAGLDAKIDGVGNVVGRSRKTGPAILIGSHTDTQAEGGWLDGALGVIAGLEVVRALAEDSKTEHLAVDIGSWVDEESSYHAFLGSRSICGDINQQQLETITTHTGDSVLELVKGAGLEGKVEPLQLDKYRAFLELHIEQGPILQDEKKPLAVVNGIFGARTVKIRFKGEQNHGGSCPMYCRKDAGVALTELAYRIHHEFPTEAGKDTVWTVGQINLYPGAPAIIPGDADMYLQFRDLDPAVLDHLELHAARLADQISKKHGVEISVARDGAQTTPLMLDSEVISAMEKAATAVAGEKWRILPSAAMHDAAIFGLKMPTGMLFVPSINGRSHCFEEDTDHEDLFVGVDALAETCCQLLL